MGVGGGELILEVSVSSTGRVTNVRTLRTTPSPISLAAIVQGWTFRPAERLVASQVRGRSPEWQAVPSKVLIAAVTVAPSVLGPTLGEVARDVAQESDETPFPMSLITPQFPVRAREGGVVLVRALVGVDGRVNEASVTQASAGGFGEVALTAVRSWSFRPARVEGLTRPANAYIVFTFQQPVLGPTVSPRPSGSP
jgi:TonB family protein